MANELLSVPVAIGTLGAAAAGVGLVCHKAKSVITSDRFALMGIMGAFVFAAQMLNFPLPFVPGASGHITGAVLLAIMLGPYAGAIAMSSVVIVQCLIFQDGGLLAMGCNIINIALVPSFAGYWIYRLFVNSSPGKWRLYAGTIAACTFAITAGAVLVPVEAALSGVLVIPFSTFLATMAGVHLVIGILEGLITAAILVYLRNVRPDTIAGCREDSVRLSRVAFYASIIIATIFVGLAASGFASTLPDGLEFSFGQTPETHIARAGVGWHSFAAVLGSGVTMGLVWFGGWVLRKKNGGQNAPRTD
ncbi:MAG: energy-coupling factor ABC transporter permease [Planctomycetota bacterium]|jgi:cobalt/nickel transport system permease protein